MAKDPRDSRDYRGFEDKVAGDLSKASLQAQALDGAKRSGNVQKMRIRDSDLPELVPAGSTIEFEQIPFHKLKFGDVIYCRFERELVLRRFIRLRMQKGGQGELHVTKQAAVNMVQILPTAALVGRVFSVESKGQTYDPRKLETGMKAFTNYITEFGTSTPLDRLLGHWQFFLRVMRKK